MGILDTLRSLGSNSILARDVQVLGGALKQDLTNGKSKLGTLAAKTLPLFLINNPLPNGKPWSTKNSSTNYYENYPTTGVIRSYDFTISRGILAPDGYKRDVLMINDAFPGPLIEANWGDTIQVTVHNNISAPHEGTALHWHGFLQKGTQWEDGVPAVSQCPIPPGQSFTYSFQAQLYGSSWYHSHYSAQYSGGLVGPIVIHGPEGDDAGYDIDLGPVLITDWYHKDYFELVEETMNATHPAVESTNNLINGKMNFNCSTVDEGDTTPCTDNAGISKFQFTRGKTHRLRLINAGAEGLQRFSIDGHTMKIIANDFVPIQPYETEVVTLGVGQRSDVLVTANGDLDAYWMRTNISSCSKTQQPYGYAAIYYNGTDTSVEPKSEAWDRPDPETCANDPLDQTVPLMPLELPDPDMTITLYPELYLNETGGSVWKLGSEAFRGNYNSPTLLLSNMGNHTFADEWQVYSTGAAKSVRVIVNNNSTVDHPMHLHGFNMYIVHEGDGYYDGTSVVNPQNPQRRDVQMLRRSGHVVMQFDASENPGVWPFHCHIAWHVSQGLFVQFLASPEAVNNITIPSTVADTCRQWGAFTNTEIPDQIDSGL